jgi:hypothetical protein
MEGAAPVDRDEVSVLFISVPDEVEQIGQAFERLEGLVGLRGRKFFGAFYPSTKEYRACVELENDDAEALGLEAGTLPGGRYLRTRLRGEPPAVYDRIAPTFEELARAMTSDDTRPSIEFYRRHDEIDLLLPIAGD